MFLKQDAFEYADQTTLLFELSGLQRVEYLKYVQTHTAEFDAQADDTPEEKRQLAYLQMGMDINAWLVSRSLWNGDQSQVVDDIFSVVRSQWSYDAQEQGATKVLELSGMLPPPADAEGEDERSDGTLSPEKP